MSNIKACVVAKFNSVVAKVKSLIAKVRNKLPKSKEDVESLALKVKGVATLRLVTYVILGVLIVSNSLTYSLAAWLISFALAVIFEVIYVYLAWNLICIAMKTASSIKSKSASKKSTV